MDRDPLTQKVIGCAIEVHRTLGPGLLESSYEACFCHELDLAGIVHRKQVSLPINYKGMLIDCAYRIDVLVEDSLLVEIKSVNALGPIHDAQILTYMKLADIGTGLLINFNVSRLIDGVRRFKL